MPERIEFKELRTSNELTEIYGKSIYEKSGKSDESFARGVVIYIGGFDPKIGNLKMLQPRFVYHDYSTGGYNIQNQDELELAVLKLGRLGALGAATKKPYPEVFSANLSKVDYGWKPCIVTYILDVFGYEFQTEENNTTASEKSFNQPVVFRRNKVVVNDHGDPIAWKFLGNELGTFSDLKHKSIKISDEISSVSALRFYNNMYAGDCSVPAMPENPQNTPPRDYCMDIYIRTEQGRKLYALSDSDLDRVVKGDLKLRASGMMEWGLPSSQFLTMVFDPPQSNGGGGGPP